MRDTRRVFRAARQKRQLDLYERWDSDSVSDYGRNPESNYQRYRSKPPYSKCNPQRRQSRLPSRHSLVRTRADYSVVSEQLRTQLRVPIFSEHNSTLLTACGKVVKVIGRCMLRILGVLITLPDNAR
ncbi:uncharacterized protein TNCV_4090541 [Trichonephila clavipes]|uniref:Uncharacterized protein n=1 Tax=Trichonephila clavipes TaxID=2585209 RepID=A0A8X6V6S1_TRICX|nr:uncharacterized protein TNCV_4090541 [Trichonephila clavipes]